MSATGKSAEKSVEKSIEGSAARSASAASGSVGEGSDDAGSQMDQSEVSNRQPQKKLEDVELSATMARLIGNDE